VLTHGHPTGYLSAAAFASIVFDVARDQTLEAAMANAESELQGESRADETLRQIARARELAAKGPPDAAAIEALGGGWVGEEALGIALVCALTAGPPGPDAFRAALWRAAAHAGDSDSTASLTGNLLGAMWGEQHLPPRWLEELELRDVTAHVADDLHAVAIVSAVLDFERYPPN